MEAITLFETSVRRGKWPHRLSVGRNAPAETRRRNIVLSKRNVLGLALAIALAPASAWAAGGKSVRLDFDAGDWVITDPNARTETYLGRNALRLRSGKAYRKDVVFENGTIEFDIAPKARPSFLGIIFRAQMRGGKLEYEHIYFRPHESGLWDASQDQPSFNGLTTWQLYQGKGYNAKYKIPYDQWLHVKIVVAGSRAEVYVNRSDLPVLVVEKLKGRPGKGYVGFWGLLPGKAPPDLYTGNFANLIIRPDESPSTYEKETPPSADTGFLTRWQVSEPLPTPKGGVRHLPAAGTVKKLKGKAVTGESSGLINLTSEFSLPQGVKKATVFARTTLRSERDQIKKLNFGYSDEISIFVNSRILYSGDNSFSSRYPRYLGTVKADEEAIYLPLKKGDNELVMAVSEAWMGWGFIARLENLDGIAIE